MAFILILALVLFIMKPRAFLRVIFAVFATLIMYISGLSGIGVIIVFIALAFPWGKKKGSS